MSNDKWKMSRSQPFDHPRSIRLQWISQTIVQAVIAALPKFDRGRLQSITAPMRWSRNVVAEFPTEFFEPLFEFCAAFKYLTLFRSPGANFASQRSRVKVLFRFFVGYLFHWAFDAYLPPNRRPVEQETGARIFRQLDSFAAAVVGEEDKATIIKALHENYAR